MSCALPMERIRELGQDELPPVAASAAWWTEETGWHAHPGSRACQSAGWVVESAHSTARLVRFTRIDVGSGSA